MDWKKYAYILGQVYIRQAGNKGLAWANKFTYNLIQIKHSHISIAIAKIIVSNIKR